jgi:hypothetical protein
VGSVSDAMGKVSGYAIAGRVPSWDRFSDIPVIF